MDEEQAINMIGKTVFTVNFSDDTITPVKITGIDDVSNKPEYQYMLLGEGNIRVQHYYDTWYLAHDSLVKHCERGVDIEMKRLGDVLSMDYLSETKALLELVDISMGDKEEERVFTSEEFRGILNNKKDTL